MLHPASHETAQQVKGAKQGDSPAMFVGYREGSSKEEWAELASYTNPSMVKKIKALNKSINKKPECNTGM
jgi:hypothetical protein